MYEILTPNGAVDAPIAGAAPTARIELNP